MATIDVNSLHKQGICQLGRVTWLIIRARQTGAIESIVSHSKSLPSKMHPFYSFLEQSVGSCTSFK